MILDFEYYLELGAPVEPVLRLFDGVGQDKAVCFAGGGLAGPKTIEALAETIRGHEDRLMGGAWINPHWREEGVAAVEKAIARWGFKAIKMMPTLSGVNVDFQEDGEQICDPLMEVAAKHGIEVTIHSDGWGGDDPLQIGVLAERFPEVPIIIDHSGYRHRMPAAIYVAKKNDNVYLGTTIMYTGDPIRGMVEKVGADRVVYGSNGDPRSGIRAVIEAGLSERETELVLWKNLAKLLRIV